MNTLAFIAFLLGMNGSRPPQAPQPAKDQVIKESSKPAAQAGKPKAGRGGWDHN